ncbi:hypothetical protein XM38_024540 [Halomicronema hongdechloris C2206]|uniref:Uncharacterized protein n=1 Tax=Halomicronema hongdechloris C2206 TaxID=1641165 RepID=A0A1Z3HMG2_9CYAN|nr:hypothetical protein [Halomicronema hongdechloris]ASC71502.1 hypothetical protein XM38_024540 [Halomicronema hongdechloris C2206]
MARSPEAKKLVPMQATLFSIKDRIQQGNLHAFSSNPVLYRDMSRRVRILLTSGSWPLLVSHPERATDRGSNEPLFRTTVGRTRKLTERGLQRQEAWAMIK